ncbi:hypothetical protein K4F52_003823 [Lecanicillium sp. MT-2017a]|nr:hypothetical protein K4F52_003823 [Lecanicillium sp. MT-2017a]
MFTAGRGGTTMGQDQQNQLHNKKHQSQNAGGAILLEQCGRVFASSIKNGIPNKIGARVQIILATGVDHYFGFTLEFPLGRNQAANEASGLDPANHGGAAVEPNDKHIISVRFPRGVSQSFTAAPSGVVKRLAGPGAEARELTLMRVALPDDSNITVTGYGMEFANSDDPQMDGWVNENKPVVDRHTLLDLLAQRSFTVVIDSALAGSINRYDQKLLKTTFKYPYGDLLTRTRAEFRTLLDKYQGPQFPPAYAHATIHDHITVVNHGVMQDVMWVDDAANEISKIKFMVYFALLDGENAASIGHRNGSLIIIPLRKEFMDNYGAAWRRLVRGDFLEVDIFASTTEKDPITTWFVTFFILHTLHHINSRARDAMIVKHRGSIPGLDIAHPSQGYELVLRVKPKRDTTKPYPFEPRSFNDRPSANRAFKKGDNH